MQVNTEGRSGSIHGKVNFSETQKAQKGRSPLPRVEGLHTDSSGGGKYDEGKSGTPFSELPM